MVGEIMQELFYAILSLISVMITSYLIPYIKQKITKEQIEKVYEFADIAVRCAEQIYSQDQWVEKRDWVFNEISEYVNENTQLHLTPSQITAIAENFVYELKQSLL